MTTSPITLAVPAQAESVQRPTPPLCPVDHAPIIRADGVVIAVVARPSSPDDMRLARRAKRYPAEDLRLMYAPDPYPSPAPAEDAPEEEHAEHADAVLAWTADADAAVAVAVPTADHPAAFKWTPTARVLDIARAMVGGLFVPAAPDAEEDAEDADAE